MGDGTAPTLHLRLGLICSIGTLRSCDREGLPTLILNLHQARIHDSINPGAKATPISSSTVNSLTKDGTPSIYILLPITHLLYGSCFFGLSVVIVGLVLVVVGFAVVGLVVGAHTLMTDNRYTACPR